MSLIMEIHGLEKSFDGVKAIDNFSCSVKKGEILGLIGLNGAGKTTLFNIISGFIISDGGKVFFKGKEINDIPSYTIANIGISRTFQDLRLIKQVSVIENVLLFFQEQLGEKLLNIFFNWKNCLAQEKKNTKRALALLKDVDLSDFAGELAESLSYGQQKLLSLVCCLATKADLLLLDEPVAGVSPEMTEKVLETISKLPIKGKTVILIEHNIDAVMQICDRIIFMDAGVKICEGTPNDVRNDSRVIEAYID